MAETVLLSSQLPFASPRQTNVSSHACQSAQLAIKRGNFAHKSSRNSQLFPGLASSSGNVYSRNLSVRSHAASLAHVTTCGDEEEHFSRLEKFEAAAYFLRVECNGRGCKPVSEEDLVLDGDENWVCSENSNEILQARVKAYHKRRQEEKDLGKRGHFYRDFAEYLNEVWMQRNLAQKYYEKGLERDPRDLQLLQRYAEFVWSELGNAEKAEEIYAKAVQEYPEDAEVLGSYASFLWQTDK
eukprot:Gb_14542 [translate_table: standard]